MDIEFWKPLLYWIEQNPGWLGLFIFIIAFTESLLIVGLIVPGVALMFGVGILIGTGLIHYEIAFLYALFGAIAGDALSYELGYAFSHKIESWSFFKKRQSFIQRGHNFFNRHGGKSILFGRFVGPVRPIIPAIAGSMEMPRASFYGFNVLSAVLWAPIVLLPGFLFGSSIELAKFFMGEFALYIVVALFILWLLFYSFVKVTNQIALRMSQSHAIVATDDPVKYQARFILLCILLCFLLFLGYFYSKSILVFNTFVYSLHVFFPLPYESVRYFLSTYNLSIIAGVVFAMSTINFSKEQVNRNYYWILRLGVAVLIVSLDFIMSKFLNTVFHLNFESELVLFSWLGLYFMSDMKTRPLMQRALLFILPLMLFSWSIVHLFYSLNGFSSVVCSVFIAVMFYNLERGWSKKPLDALQCVCRKSTWLFVCLALSYVLLLKEAPIEENIFVKGEPLLQSSTSILDWTLTPRNSFDFESSHDKISLLRYLESQGWQQYPVSPSVLVTLHKNRPQALFHSGGLPELVFRLKKNEGDESWLVLWPNLHKVNDSKTINWFALQLKMSQDDTVSAGTHVFK